MGFPAIVPASALGHGPGGAPSNRITLGFIGTGDHGTKVNLRRFLAEPDAQVVALCDADAGHVRDAHLGVQVFAARDPIATYRSCTTTQDWREIVARDDIDAVVISTPDHWHVLPAIAAAKAGKDVFGEKPLSLTIREGRVLADTIRRCGRIFQTGTDVRTSTFHRACTLARNGRLGKLHTIHANIYAGYGMATPENPVIFRDSVIPVLEPVPSGFDYDMWLGPAPDAPYCASRCHISYRYILDYSGGNLTDFGGHAFDIVQWGNGSQDTGPVSVEGKGVFPKDGLFNAATDWHIEYEYANGVRLICESGGFSIRFEGSDGWVEADWDGLTASSDKILNAVIGPEEIHLRQMEQGEQRDFLDCVKSRRQASIPAEVGHRTVTLSHLGNIAMILGRKLQWDPAAERFVNDDDANRMISRPMRSPWRLEG